MNVNPFKTSYTSFGGSDMQVSYSNGTMLWDVLDPTYTVQVGSGSTVKVEVPPLGVRILSQ